MLMISTLMLRWFMVMLMFVLVLVLVLCAGPTVAGAIIVMFLILYNIYLYM
jgi:hypothetical protein|eukprot:COSAG06_NODE_4078_length_4596_cov_3453.381281_5_plen_51_part_00